MRSRLRCWLTGHDWMADRPRCSHCGRRVSRGGHMTITHDGVESAFCSGRAACRRASHERHGAPVPISGASDEALGAALIAADYVRWPWWGRLLPEGARDEVRSRFARMLASAVERSVKDRQLGWRVDGRDWPAEGAMAPGEALAGLDGIMPDVAEAAGDSLRREAGGGEAP